MSSALPLLRKYQLFKVGYRLKSQEFSGTLVLQEPDGKTVITFDAGNPVTAASTQVSLSFPAFLLRKRRIERQDLKKLLEESSEKGIKLEELLVSKGLFSPKDLLRLKRELSVFVFASAFRKEKVPYRVAPGDMPSEERARTRGHLELHEGLFRAVAADKDLAAMERMFRDRWSAHLTKTADFYRYLIQFRSVFYGEDITDLLMEPEPTPKSVVDAASDKESATRQLFALCYSGMLTLDTEAEGKDQFFGEGAGDAEESKTVVILPQGDDDTAGQETSFIASDGLPLTEQAGEEEGGVPVAPLSEVERFLERGFGTDGIDEEPILSSGPTTPPARRAPDSAEDESAPPQPAAPGRAALPPEPLEEDAGMTLPMAPAQFMSTQEAPQEMEIPVPLDQEDGDAAAGATLTFTPGAAARQTEAGNVEDLLKRAVEEAEKVVAEREAERPDESEEEPGAPGEAGEEVAEDAVEEPAAEARPAQRGKSVSLAALEPEPMPERPAMPDPGTDESIERILEDVYRSMLSRNLYQVLNVTPFAPLSAIRESAARLKAKYEPGQYRGYMLSARAKLLLDYVGQELDRACEVLTEHQERLAYDTRVGTDYGQDRRVALSFLFDAEEAFQQGLEEMEKGNWPDALILFTKAGEANPRDPEYLAHKGWATYQALKSGQSSDSFAPNKARNILERALAVDSRHIGTMLFLARIEKDMGNLEAARLWYERVQKLDPTNDEVLASLDWLKSSAGTERRSEEGGAWNRFKGIFRRK